MGSERKAGLTREAERELVRQSLDGDRSALRDLVDHHKDRLYAFIVKIVGHHHDTEEICQEAFLKAFSALDSFSTEYRFSTWLFTIAYRVCLNAMRRRQALTGDVDFTALPGTSQPDPSDQTVETEDARELKKVVWDAVDRLSGPQRAAIILFYRHSQSCQEIAAILDIPVATVKSHLHRARARLREVIEQEADRDMVARKLRFVAG